jgi:eukaryotic-like serine/threonine-protein kinase
VDRISHYRLVARLGKGAMGEVWRAVDERLGRAVALKLLPAARASQQKLQARLLREAQAASALNHPGIVTVHDVGSWQGQTFMVMELVEGEPLSELARTGVPIAEALRLVADAAEALAAAHERDILHRDIKSDNLMRTRDGRVKVLDFGLAKLRAQPDDNEPTPPPGPADGAVPADSGDHPPLSVASQSGNLTMAGALVGTPVYMAPEQTDGTPGDTLSEVWSLGVVLYELVTGKRPFERASIHEVLVAIRTQPILKPSLVALPGRVVPARVDEIVMKALARDRTQRYADMRAFATALRQARRRLGGIHSGAEQALPGGRRLILPMLAGAALLLGFAGYAWIGRRPPAAPRREAPVTVTTTRRLTFDPGCEEYPSFAPDGRTLVFDGVAENDYELLAIDTVAGTRSRLTHAHGWDYGGVISPDGKSIAYVHTTEAGRELRVLPIGGDANATPHTLGFAGAGYPSWTHDGGVLVGVGDEIVRFDGERKSTIARLPAGSSDRYVVELANGDLVAQWQPQYANEVVVGELVHGAATARVVETLPIDSIGVLAAPSHTAYYYGRHHANANELVRRAFGGVADAVPRDVTPGSGISISPDGKRLAYSTCSESSVIARLRSGKPPEPLLAAGNWRDIWPVPVDGRRVAFHSDRSGSAQVWLLDVKSHEARPLVPAPSSDPAVSPDGKWLAYAGGAEPGIHVVPVDGGAARRLTKSDADGEPQFGFDGKTLVFGSGAGGARIYAVDLAGGPPRLLSPVGALSPAPSPTADLVVFVQQLDDGRVLMVTDLHGRRPTPLSPKLGVADWGNPRFSRDGKKLLVVRKNSEVVEIELATDQPRVVYRARLEGIGEANYAADGDGLIASVQLWNGDLWLAEGSFR